LKTPLLSKRGVVFWDSIAFSESHATPTAFTQSYAIYYARRATVTITRRVHTPAHAPASWWYAPTASPGSARRHPRSVRSSVQKLAAAGQWLQHARPVDHLLEHVRLGEGGGGQTDPRAEAPARRPRCARHRETAPEGACRAVRLVQAERRADGGTRLRKSPGVARAHVVTDGLVCSSSQLWPIARSYAKASTSTPNSSPQHAT